jgi:hypothetical protein
LALPSDCVTMESSDPLVVVNALDLVVVRTWPVLPPR